MKFSSCLALFGALALNHVNGYANPNPTACSGVSICVDIVGGFEFAVTNANGTVIGCQFGQTSNDTKTDERCSVPCDEDLEAFCVCVSKSDAEAGLFEDAQFQLLIGVIFLVVFVLIIPVQCYRRQVYYKQATAFMEEVKKHEGKTDNLGIQPEPPSEWLIWIAYLTFFIVFVVFFVKFSHTKNADFWAGCGAEGDILGN